MCIVRLCDLTYTELLNIIIIIVGVMETFHLSFLRCSGILISRQAKKKILRNQAFIASVMSKILNLFFLFLQEAVLDFFQAEFPDFLALMGE